MTLLFDRNLSPRLVQLLAGIYPDSAHVMDIGLCTADDSTIWAFARERGFAIVSNDGDFRGMGIDPVGPWAG